MLHINYKMVRFAAILSSAVITKICLIFVSYLCGQWLDKKFNVSPFFVFFLVILSFSLGLWWIFRLVEKYKPF